MSVDVYLLEEQSFQISSLSDLKWQSLRLFGEVTPARRTRRRTKWV